MIKHFELAELLFVSEEDCIDDNISPEEISDIKNRFKMITDSFIIPDKHYVKGSKTDNSILPYNSGVRMKGTYYVEIGDYLILHFTSSYSKPLMFMYNIKTGTVYNYIFLRVAKKILDNDVYEAVFNGLHQRRVMDNMLRGITDFNDFVNDYMAELESHKHSSSGIDTDCFKVLPHNNSN